MEVSKELMRIFIMSARVQAHPRALAYVNLSLVSMSRSRHTMWGDQIWKHQNFLPFHLPPLHESRLTFNSWNFYIARPGSTPQDCIDWERADVKISGLTYAGEWVEFKALIAEPGATVRFDFPSSDGGWSIHVVVFPWASKAIPDDVPIHLLKTRNAVTGWRMIKE